MAANISAYPGLAAALNPAATETRIEERFSDGLKYLRVTQTFAEGEGEQFLFLAGAAGVELLKTDNVVNFPNHDLGGQLGYSGAMSDQEHAAVAAEAIASVDVFKTGAGPGQGSVACLWAARRVVFKAVNQWITQSDGTAEFYGELQAGGMVPAGADTLPAGAIIISPTAGKAVGHIGLLGAGAGHERLVYSNHSPSKSDPVARWKQNYTVGSFTDYHTAKGLPTLFYRLPKPVKI